MLNKLFLLSSILKQKKLDVGIFFFTSLVSRPVINMFDSFDEIPNKTINRTDISLKGT